MGNTPGLVALHSRAARLLAVEVLLADPEALADDVLESALYLLRDRLSATPGNPDIPVLDAALFQPLHEVIATFTSAGWRVASFGTVIEPSSGTHGDVLDRLRPRTPTHCSPLNSDGAGRIGDRSPPTVSGMSGASHVRQHGL